MRFKVIFVFWVVMPCGLLVKYKCFGSTYCLHLQGYSSLVEESEGSKPLISKPTIDLGPQSILSPLILITNLPNTHFILCLLFGLPNDCFPNRFSNLNSAYHVSPFLAACIINRSFLDFFI